MTRLNIKVNATLFYHERELLYKSRHRDRTVWIHYETNEEFSFTDLEIADLLAAKDAILLQGGASGGSLRGGEVAPHVEIAFEARSESEQAEALLRYEYVSDARNLDLCKEASNDDLQRSSNATTLRLGRDKAPLAETIRGWLKRAGEQPTLGRLGTRNAAKGNRTPRLLPEAYEITDHFIDTFFSAVSSHPYLKQLVESMQK